ncbi:YhjD/YihY/BrkB family envelope integrity protein [Gordonia rubripertincta]|uniref:YihY/virulence factor BrkB family protein n=1 Tax=Gordonia rubripertincta TaxID=36822 RepID=A0ABT4N1A4_GORRU|nr:YhjD/YihY/BrkB family envelope integrity protein [Gordonia rubripertincta]MCZ4553043.1 YihY/virulence factor BrkB family protein [Gordonia rubripertincta]
MDRPAAASAPTAARVRILAELRTIAGDASRRLSRGDLAGTAATLTYYSAIAIVPWLLFAVWSISWFDDTDEVYQRLLSLRVLIPPDMGARSAYDGLVDAGVHAGLLTALVLMFPASFYGEGLRRSAHLLLPESNAGDEAERSSTIAGDEAERSSTLDAWRARGTVLALFVVVPPLAWIYSTIGEQLVGLTPEGGGGGLGDLVLRYYLGFLTTWIMLSVVLTWVFRYVMPGGPRWRVALVGALITGSMLAGFLQGFALFLSIPIDVGLPFAGLTVVGGVVAVGLWLWILHMVLLAGWSLTRTIDTTVDSWVRTQTGKGSS